MGVTTTQSSQTQYQPTPTETSLMKNELQLSNAALPGQIQNTQQSQGLISQLLTGGALPGYLNMLPGGVSKDQSMNEAQLGLQALAPQFNAMGGLDTGAYAQAGANTFAQTLNSNAQFNVQNLAQLLNLASGQAYGNQGQVTANNQMLGSQSGALAGSTNRSSLTSNPFLQSFYSSMGQGISSGLTGSASGGASQFAHAFK